MLISQSIKQGDLVLSTDLIMQIRHRKEIRKFKFKFRALAIRRCESRNCAWLCVVYIQKDGASLLHGLCMHGNVKNKRIN